VISSLVIFDVESTGLSAKDEVIQFGALIINVSDFSIVGVVNEYCMSSVPISYDAMAVHKITPKQLDLLSSGNFFEDVVEKYGLRCLSNVAWTSFGIVTDIKLCNNTLSSNGYTPINFGVRANNVRVDEVSPIHFCSKGLLYGVYGVKSGTLSEFITRCFGLSKFISACQQFVELNNMRVSVKLHNAFVDAFALYCLLAVNKVSVVL
jgi:DNA polymerase III epsilon subunit-like protein